MKKNRTHKRSNRGGVKLLIISSLLSLSVFSQAPPNQQNALNATGNVGVGTISPDSKLQVNGSMSVDSSLTVRDTVIFEKQARMKDKVIVEGEAIIKGQLTARDDLKVLGTTKIEGPLKITNLPNVQVNDTTLLFVNSNGKVKAGGIPGLLNVMFANPQSANILKGIVYGTLPLVELCLTGIHGETILSPPYWQVGLGKIFILNTNCSPDVMLGVGIVPEAKFHIRTSQGYSTDPVLIEKSIAENSPQKLLQLDNNGWLYSHSLSLSETYTSPNTFALLSVTNVNRAAALSLNAVGNTNNYSKLIFMEYDAVNTQILNVLKSNSGTSTFVVNGDGSFFLYNPYTSQKLLQMDEGGVIKSRAIYIDQLNWPDYVFKSNYKLPSLSETEQFIKENGHLPNLPSSNDIETKGLNIGEMNKILMQKVEELTLHLIAQEKQLKDQANQLRALQEASKTKTEMP